MGSHQRAVTDAGIALVDDRRVYVRHSTHDYGSRLREWGRALLNLILRNRQNLVAGRTRRKPTVLNLGLRKSMQARVSSSELCPPGPNPV